MPVFLVDDSALVLRQLKHLLERAGMADACAFTDPRVALAMCRKSPPDLVLLDFNMPELDGLQFLVELQRDPVTAQIPVVMISGWASASLRVRALRAGAVDVIDKPFVAQEIQLKVHNLLRLAGRRQPRHQAEPLPGAQSAQDIDGWMEGRDGPVLRLLERLTGIRADRSGRSMVQVGQFAATIGAACGLNPLQQALLARATPFHDIGSWSVPSEVLAGGATVSTRGRQQLDERAEAGHSVLAGHASPLLQMAAEISLSRLEHWDGSGVPAGLAGEAIPLSGRIVAVADMFEQMTVRRPPTLTALSAHAAADVIRADQGRQFDPAVVLAFDQALARLIQLNDQRASAGAAASEANVAHRFFLD